jgi:hypothetical protein
MMKSAILFPIAAALVSGVSLSLAAQQAAAGADQSATARGAASTKLSAMAFDYMRPVSCELAGKLDSKSAKVGDAVVVKTTENLRMEDGSVIPKGAKLIGHVTDAQAHSSGQADAHLSIAFDRAEWSGGHSIPIHSVIQTVTRPVNAFASASTQSDDSLGGPMAGPGAHGMAGVHAGGGSLGGTAGVGTTAGSVAGSVGADASNLGAAAGGGLQRTAGQTAGDIGPVAGPGVSAATSASMSEHPTGVPGVMLAGDASGATAGTLSASNHNVHLDSGTQLTLAVSAASSQ